MDEPAAGYVLAGGKSRRMGADKALLPFGNFSLVEHIAAELRAVVTEVTVVGQPRLDLPNLDDLYPDHGPLGGIVTALTATSVHWNLIVACDMPGVHRVFLSELLNEASQSNADCLMPVAAGRMHPLCAVYSRDCLAELRATLEAGERKVTQAIGSLRVKLWSVSNASILENVNTPADWMASQSRRSAIVP